MASRRPGSWLQVVLDGRGAEHASRHGVEVPITSEAYHVLFEGKDPKQAVFDLMTRAAKGEDWG